MAKGWYVVHTYSGYEQKIERIINKLRQMDPEFAVYCTGVNVPMETVETLNDKGEKKMELRKVLPGYILVELDLEESTWRQVTSKIIRIQGVTGFISADKSGRAMPNPLSQREHRSILERTGELAPEKTFRPKQDFVVGECRQGRYLFEVKIGNFGKQTPYGKEHDGYEREDRTKCCMFHGCYDRLNRRSFTKI